MSDPVAAAPSRPVRPRWVKPATVVAVLLVIVVTVRATGLTAWLTVENLRALMERLGPAGVLTMVVLFVGGTLLNIPPLIFVFASLLAYGKWAGAAVAATGALSGMAVNFWLVRRIGGTTASSEINNRFLRKALAQVEAQPFWTVVGIRLVVQLLPAMNTTLALTRISFRHFMLGSAAAVIPMMVGLALAFDWVYARISG